MNQPWNVIRASQIAGVVLDCDLTSGAKIGGGTATDNTAALNALLATASATNPIKLILDGPSLVTGLVLSSSGYTCIEGIGWESGIFVKSGSVADAIVNGSFAFQPSGSPPTQGGPVELRNFMINGNRGNGTTGNSNTGNPRGIVTTPAYWLCNIALYGVKGVRIEDMYIYDSPTYSIRLMNCSDVNIDRNQIINPNTTAGFNNDGIHLDAPITDCYINGNHIDNNNSDDAIAINAPEGYVGTAIDRVVVQGNTFSNVLHAIRIYGASDGQVGSVVFNGNEGTASVAVVWVGVGTAGSGDVSGREIKLSNNTFQLTSAGSWLYITSNIGDITMSDCTMLSPVAAANMVGISTGTVSALAINNARIYRTTSGNNTSTALLAADGAATIKRVTINGFSVVDQEGQSYSAIAKALSMTNLTLTSLNVQAIDYTNITALADSYTNITNLYGQYQPESNLQKVTSAYTALVTDRTVLGDTTSAAFAITLPAKAYKGGKYTFKNISSGANALTITGTIDGAANPTLASMAKMTVEYDGSAYWTVS